MKTMLLPHYMRIIGWILFVPCLVVGVLILVEVLSLNGVVGVVVNDTAIIGIAIGALLFVVRASGRKTRWCRPSGCKR